MATRTEPIRLLLLFKRGRTRACGSVLVMLACLAFRLRTFPADDLVEPSDFAFDGLEPVVLQLEGVAVDSFPGPRQGGRYAFQPLFQPAAPAFQDAEAYVGPGMGEEGEMDAEPFILPSRR